MNEKVLVIAVAVVASVILATQFVGAVPATESMAVNFTSIGLGVVTSSWRQAGESDTWINTAVHNLLWQGDFEGNSVMEVRLVFYDYGTPDQTYTYHEIVTFTGTFLQEYTGTLTIMGGQGNWRVMSGTGELSNLRGQGKMQLSGPGTWSFTGQVHF